jgi:phosphatidylglycerophosphate synthase
MYLINFFFITSCIKKRMSILWILVLLIGMTLLSGGLYLVAKEQGKAEEGSDSALGSANMVGGGTAITFGLLLFLYGAYKNFSKPIMAEIASE